MTIREALRELDLWGAAAVFSLTDYEDSHKHMLRLIKDWKDLVNQVRARVSRQPGACSCVTSTRCVRSHVKEMKVLLQSFVVGLIITIIIRVVCHHNNMLNSPM